MKKKLENENRRRTLLSYTEEGHRLQEEDLNHTEEERRTLCSDAVVVRETNSHFCIFIFIFLDVVLFLNNTCRFFSLKRRMMLS